MIIEYHQKMMRVMFLLYITFTSVIIASLLRELFFFTLLAILGMIISYRKMKQEQDEILLMKRGYASLVISEAKDKK